MLPLFEKIIAIKNGKPNKAVILPTGKDVPFPITLDSISASNNNKLPANNDDTSKYLWSFPIIFRQICGHIIPTNPMIPKKETQTAVISDENNKDIILRV